MKELRVYEIQAHFLRIIQLLIHIRSLIQRYFLNQIKKEYIKKCFRKTPLEKYIDNFKKEKLFL